MSSITMKQGEAKTITFTVTDSDGVAIDCSSTTLSFVVVEQSGQPAKISKEDSDFNKTNALIGIILLPLNDTDSDIPAMLYVSQLKIIFNSTNIDKSVDIDFTIERSAI